MQIANVIAGFSMAEGDGLRKAMGKKLPEEMAEVSRPLRRRLRRERH